jgi:hypothetical protein
MLAFYDIFNSPPLGGRLQVGVLPSLRVSITHTSLSLLEGVIVYLANINILKYNVGSSSQTAHALSRSEHAFRTHFRLGEQNPRASEEVATWRLDKTRMCDYLHFSNAHAHLVAMATRCSLTRCSLSFPPPV